jgi:regulatory protein
VPSCYPLRAHPQRRRKPGLKPEAAADPSLLRKTALDCLARREHSTAELARKLAARQFAPGAIESVLAELAAEGLLDDTRFAESFVHSRIQRGQGPQKIRAQLRERGIGEGQIGECLAEYDSLWRERIEAVRRKRFGPDLPADFRERSRQMRFLQQRGFTPEQIGALFHASD